jgi:hypothetical protein
MPVRDISAWALGNAAVISGTIVSGHIASGSLGRFHIASGAIGSGAYNAATAQADLGAFTGGLVGFLDAAERDGVRTKINNIILALKDAGIMLSG